MRTNVSVTESTFGVYSARSSSILFISMSPLGEKKRENIRGEESIDSSASVSAFGGRIGIVSRERAAEEGGRAEVKKIVD